MDDLSPMAKVMNSVPGGYKISYLWKNTFHNTTLMSLDKKKMIEVYHLEPHYFEDGHYHVVKVANGFKKTLTPSELKEELGL